MIWSRGRHVITVGGGFLARRLSTNVTPFQDGLFDFANLQSFAAGQAELLEISRLRQTPTANVAPDDNGDYRYQQFFLFAQDSVESFAGARGELRPAIWRISARPKTSDRKRTRSCNWDRARTSCSGSPARTWSSPEPATKSYTTPTITTSRCAGGFSYSPLKSSRVVLRGGFGIFYDRPFDNIWLTMQANNLLLATAFNPNIPFQLPVLQAAAATNLQVLPAFTFGSSQQSITFFQGNLRSGYAENGSLGLEQRISDRFTIQTNFVSSLGRELLTADIVNRPLSAPVSFSNLFGVANPSLPMLNYYGNQGISNYYAGQAVIRYRASNLQLQFSYTLSHAIDNQSEPLAQSFLNFNLAFNPQTSSAGPAAFTRQFDSNGDRATADFDQRHNAVQYAVWEIPGSGRYFRNWTVGFVTAMRSGFPYSPLAPSLFASGAGQFLFNNRANLIGSPAILNAPGPGGVQILNPAAFAIPAAGQVGNIGRNAFEGPGLYSADVSLSRRFALAELGESGRLTVRADAFNVLNHANLNNPNSSSCSYVGCSGFGFAQFGLQSVDKTGFPASTPFQESPRVIQLGVRVDF